ncbi:MAG TPA: helix-turn-helix domain-containing protein [Streptosporangiaceae bacterium]|jgi:DNA-binding MarR family transcriptional regulator|nr:helix-turn-helix domain-containing protein [Streptosporangiaceae bacterium]
MTSAKRRVDRTTGHTERRRLATEAWAAVLQVHAGLVPALDQLLSQTAGLPLSWYDVLLELAAAPERRLLMGELGKRVVLSRTRVSRIVDELAAAGLVRKESNPRDGRSSYAVLAEEGLARYRAAAPVYLAGIEREFAASLTDAELAAVATALRKVVDRPLQVDIGAKARNGQAT